MKSQKRVVWVLIFALLIGMMPMTAKPVKAASDTGVKYEFQSDNKEVTVSLREVKDNDNWYEYYLTVTNQSGQSICDWSIRLNCSNPDAYSKAFDCTATVDKSAGTLTVAGTGNYKVVSAGQNVSSTSTFKIGFGSPVSFSSGAITYSYGTQSSVEDPTEIDGSNNTYVKGYQCHYNLTGEAKTMAWEDTPVGKHGSLHVDGTQLKDENNQPTILRGASTHGMHWDDMKPFVNKAAFQNLRDEWGVDMVRLVSYVTQGGYTQGAQSLLDTKIQEGVSYAEELGMYAIIDWHIHDEDPSLTKEQALAFFDKYSKMYKDKEHVLYEICNEPNRTPWNQIKTNYAEEVVTKIRSNDPDAIIIVGTNTWSQDVDEVATNGGKIDADNVMYTIHFYSGSHGQSMRDKVTTALNAGTPIFCTEFGICHSSGNGGFNLAEANAWIDYFEEKGISYSCWSLCNKNESAAMISPTCTKKSGWTNEDLGTTGAWLINTYRGKRGDVPDAPIATPESQTTAIPQQSQQPTGTERPAVSSAPGEIVLAENLGAEESFEVSDMSWFQDGSEDDEITVVYTCDDSTHANWGILGWGATVDGTWSDGVQYQAGAIATMEMTKTITIGELKESLGASDKSVITGLKLSAYGSNGGRIIKISVMPKTSAEPTQTPTAPSKTVAPIEPGESSTPIEPSETVAPVEPSETIAPTAPSETIAPVEPGESSTPIAPSETIAPTAPSETIAPIEPGESSTPTEPSKTVAPVEPSETIAPIEPGESSTPIAPSETVAPVVPSETIAPSENVTPEGVGNMNMVANNGQMQGILGGLKVTFSGKKMKIKWEKVRGAVGYEVYVTPRQGKKVPKMMLSAYTGDRTSITISKTGNGKLNPKGMYWVYVIAYDMQGENKRYGVNQSQSAYVVGKKHKKFTNAKKLISKKKKIVLKKGKSKKLVIKVKKQVAKKGLLSYKNSGIQQLRYRSSNAKVATVSTKGKVKAKGKGSCTIYVVAANGVATKIKVTVR